jgi:hypothetical protein
MAHARVGFCCTFVSPTGDEEHQRLLNMRLPTIASIARAEDGAQRLEEAIAHNLDTLGRQIEFVAARRRSNGFFASSAASSSVGRIRQYSICGRRRSANMCATVWR